MSLSSDDNDKALLGVAASATGRTWARRLGLSEERTATALAQRHNVPEVVARVLAGRGVTLEAAVHELEPRIRHLLPDPSTLMDCDRLVAHLADAIHKGERIVLFGDYDVDGATSAALVARTLRALGSDPAIIIPDRISDGYGPSVERMEALAQDGVSLVVCLDCGSSAHAPIATANDAGMRVLVIDHHPAEVLAPAAAVVNPNRNDDLSGLGALAAVGVAFVVMVALVREMRRRRPDCAAPDLLAYTDLVALGTVADVVPLTALNRAFVRAGLQAMRRGGNVGLSALIGAARIGGPVNAGHLGFVLGPRINAGGRIGSSSLGAKLLTTDDPGEAEAIALQLDALNAERRGIEKRATEEAMAMAGEGPVIVVAGDWHPGVVGLVASRLKERFRRPAVAIGLQGETGTGSGRSINGVDLGAAIRAAVDAGLLAKGGGHAMAAGLTVDAARIDELSAFLTARLGETVDTARARDALQVDAVVGLGSLDEALAQALARFGPWGAGRPRPVFAVEGAIIAGVQPVGQGDALRGLAARPGRHAGGCDGVPCKRPAGR
ncbi:MAG: single-stranded-DNA-specific exonuclease RecJ [Pseudomonadota bacterium]